MQNTLQAHCLEIPSSFNFLYFTHQHGHVYSDFSIRNTKDALRISSATKTRMKHKSPKARLGS